MNGHGLSEHGAVSDDDPTLVPDPALSPNPLLAGALARRLDSGARHVDIGRDASNGIAKLVLALLNLIHELLERQAMRRIDSGRLSEAQIESLGEALMNQAITIVDLCEQLGLAETDLDIDLGPLGHLVGDMT